MAATLSIGDFARMTFLSVKQLRHYHELGLLEPTSIDPDTGYRHYSVDQVPGAQVIRRFRDLGMGLDELRVVLTAPDVASRNAAIVAHLTRMEAELAHTQATVVSLRNLLAAGPGAIPVDYRARPAIPVLAIIESPIGEDVTMWREAAFAALHREADRQDLTIAGPDGALYPTELLESGAGAVTAFLPVTRRAQAARRFQSVELPAGEYAIAVHTGPLEDLDQTFAALGTAVAERALGVDGPIQENYLDPQTIEVCWPIFQTTTGDPS